MIPRPVYSALLYIAAPFAMFYLSKRAKKQPEYSEHWDERFGTAHYPPVTPGRTRIWIHAVSVGETRATFSLVESISSFVRASLHTPVRMSFSFALVIAT